MGFNTPLNNLTMARTKPNSLVYGLYEILGKYVLSRTYLCIVIPLIIALIMAANSLYSLHIPSLASEIEKHIDTGDLYLHRNLLYKFFIYGLSAIVLEYIPIFVMSLIIQDIYRDCYRDVFLEYISLEYNTFHSIAPGDMENKINRKCKAVGEAVDITIPTLMNSGTFVIISLFVVYREFGFYMSLLFLVIPVLYISVTIFLTTRRNRIRGRYNKAKDKSLRKLNDILYNYEVVKTYGLEDKESYMFHTSLDDRVTTGTAYYRSENVMNYLQKLSAIVPHIGILYLTLNSGILTLDRAMKLNLLHSTLKERLAEFAKEFNELYEYYFDYATSTFDVEQDLPEQVNITAFEREIVINNVEIKRGAREILRNISFVLKKGDKLAVTGPNGAGKSTFINTLLRFLDYSGEILIDGVEMKNYTKKSIRQLVAYVPQDNCIIDDTVLKNLQYGNKDISFEKVKEICMKYKTHEKFESLEGGYLKQAGQQGCELSGGQKQYLSLMRAIIKNSSIFIFDEVTSNVDRKTEMELIDYIINVIADRTIIMIVHNHALLKKFDKVLFLKDKTMKGYGTLDELFNSSKDFTDFYLEEDMGVLDTGIQPEAGL